MRYFLIITLFLASFQSSLFAQKEYKIGCIGFYNFENLFDTLDTPDVRDTEFTPSGKRLYNSKIYYEKLDNLADVVSQLGTKNTPDGVSLLGVCEIENKEVLEDFVQRPKIKDRDYQIVHYNSIDKRGIDVALLYQPKYFTVESSRPIRNHIKNREGEPIFTRDILLVSGVYDGDPMHILVNHWPSRRGGEKATEPLRNQAAFACKKIVDSLEKVNPYARVIVMGDLNDDPTNPSCKKVLNAKRDKENLKKGEMYNPMYDYYKRGIGTTAYRDAWSLFDQIIMSRGLIEPNDDGYQYFKTTIFNERFLVQKTGRYEGYPFRTYSFDTYQGGYSDHFPVFVYLVKEIKK